MPLVNTQDIAVNEKHPGWRGRLIHSSTMTFAHWRFEAGADIHEHHHEQEEVWHVIEGELELTIGDEHHLAGPGFVVIVPPLTPHSVTARTGGFAIVADHPTRPGF